MTITELEYIVMVGNAPSVIQEFPLTMSQTIVILGLLVDGVGAMMIATPDLPRSKRQNIHRFTPWIRGLLDSKRYFRHYRGDDSDDFERDRQEIEYHLKVVWPAIQDRYERDEEIEDFDEVVIEPLDRDGAKPWFKFRSQSRAEPIKVDMNAVGSDVDEYIEKWYRTRGWILLSVGFGIQIIGTLL